MKKILFLMVMLVFGLTSCVEDNPYENPATISSVTYSPEAVTAADDVTVTAKVTDMQGISSVKIQYKVDGASKSDINMVSGGNDTYTGVIPKQPDGAVVSFTVVAVNNAGLITTSKEQKYTVGAAPIDYTQLVLNEIDGNSKSIELHNKGTVDIPLDGVTLVKNNDTTTLWWRGSTASGSIPAGGYVLIIQNNTNTALAGAGGISPKKSLKFELKSPTESSLGIFLRGSENNLDANISDVAPKSYQRIPNGTGDWKMADPTNGAQNASTGTDIPQS